MAFATSSFAPFAVTLTRIRLLEQRVYVADCANAVYRFEHRARRLIVNAVGLQREQTRNHLKVVLYPVVNSLSSASFSANELVS
jgi:hypothetical protein